MSRRFCLSFFPSPTATLRRVAPCRRKKGEKGGNGAVATCSTGFTTVSACPAYPRCQQHALRRLESGDVGLVYIIRHYVELCGGRRRPPEAHGRGPRPRGPGVKRDELHEQFFFLFSRRRLAFLPYPFGFVQPTETPFPAGLYLFATILMPRRHPLPRPPRRRPPRRQPPRRRRRRPPRQPCAPLPGRPRPCCGRAWPGPP